MTAYDPEQLAAGFRSMCMLSALVRRGGHPAAVAPTTPLRLAEKQYAWFPVTAGADERRVAIVTNQRLIVGEEIPLRAIARVRPGPDWDLTLEVHGRALPLVLRGPWVPWLSVVICAELYGTPFPPAASIPGQRNRDVREKATLS